MRVFVRIVAAFLFFFCLSGNMLFAAELSARVRNVRIREANINASYPQVVLEDKLAESKINMRIKSDIDRFVRSVRSSALLNPNFVGNLTYRVTCNKADVFSFILRHKKEYGTSRQTAIYEQGYIFKLKSGNQATYTDVLAIARVLSKEQLYNIEALNTHIKNQLNRRGVVPLSSFTGLSYFPDNLYMDEKLRFHMLIQPGVVADKAAGMVDIDIDEENW